MFVLLLMVKGRNIDFPVSQKIVSDPFAGYYGDGILEPPYNLDCLPQTPVTQNIQQLMPPSTREVIMKSAPINEVQPLWQREAMTSGSPTIQAAIGNLPTNTITERTEKIAGTNTITNNNVIERVKEVTNNNNVTAGATEKIIENNRTQELQLLSQPPVVTQPLVQVTNPDTGEVVVKALENAQLKIPFRRKLTAWGISFPVYFRCRICASKHA